MKLNSWKTSILIGAMVGLAVSMFNKEDRQVMKTGSKKTYDQIKHVYKHPSQSLQQLRLRLNQVNQGTNKLLDQLDQLERIFHKYDQDKKK
ncbi:hypothetical protein [Tenuibacillus multivorans]|uniref:EF-hand domain-containing protein n=1 Tax=Tenuibacillus multivorans TaxID=237069 RepID=A0A1H0G0M2_9BACI|nr:hypothetical protein [Tenuibacillus multivorans]GEL78133.1 hypothetical protein TMU01_23680 [Tenuibacillus multivorans]SDO00371.1 hypothetical protein SAMN05216498_0423 [Tenuibacillus multivorans]